MNFRILAIMSTCFFQGASQTNTKQEALAILHTKCNVCHAKQNPRMVFTASNMDKRAGKVNWQVFILRRMPKGDAIRLDETERKILKQWIESVTR
jgi:uncharacterized membrane protein